MSVIDRITCPGCGKLQSFCRCDLRENRQDLRDRIADMEKDLRRTVRLLEIATDHLGRQGKLVAELERELREARLDARILAHSYETDSRPPIEIVDRSLAWTVRGEAPAAHAARGEEGRNG